MVQGDGYVVAHREELERTGNWTLVRRSLGCKSFGVNLVEIQPGEAIPEHDETSRDQEELFSVVSGCPTLVIDGEDHPAEPGTFARRGGVIDVTAPEHPAGHAHDAAVDVDQRSTRETRIQWRVGLDQVLHLAAPPSPRIRGHRADRSKRRLQAAGPADGQHDLTRLQVGNLASRCAVRAQPVDPQQRDISGGVAADQRGLL